MCKRQNGFREASLCFGKVPVVANQSISVPMEKAVVPGWWERWRENWAENRLAYFLLLPSTLAYVVFLFYPDCQYDGFLLCYGGYPRSYHQYWHSRQLCHPVADPNLPMVMGHTLFMPLVQWCSPSSSPFRWRCCSIPTFRANRGEGADPDSVGDAFCCFGHHLALDFQRANGFT